MKDTVIFEKQYKKELSNKGTLEITIRASTSDCKDADIVEVLRSYAQSSRNFYLEFGNELNT